jgi:hypothetical protein
MLSKTQKDLLKLLEILWNQYPDQRFGQLLFNYTRIGTRTSEVGVVKDPFFYQDKDILKDIQHELK